MGRNPAFGRLCGQVLRFQEPVFSKTTDRKTLKTTGEESFSNEPTPQSMGS